MIGPPNHIIWAGAQCAPPGADCNDPTKGSMVQQSPCVATGGFGGHWDVAGMKGEPGKDAPGTCHYSSDGSTNANPSQCYVANVRDDNFVWSPYKPGDTIPPTTVFTAGGPGQAGKILAKTVPNATHGDTVIGWVSVTSDGKMGQLVYDDFGGKTADSFQLAVCVPPPKPAPPPPPPLSKNPCIRFGHTIPVGHHVDVEISQAGPPAITSVSVCVCV